MPSWLVTLIQQFGREIVAGAPDAAKAGQREFHNLRDPYVDKWVYWMGRGGEWELDAADHRRYDELTAVQKVRLTELQLSGKLGRYNQAKPKHRRPWTGAANASVETDDEMRRARLERTLFPHGKPPSAAAPEDHQ